MKFHIISIFPEAFESFTSHSIIGKAFSKGLFELTLYKLNDFSPETSGHIDAKAFGMHGQVLKPEPLSRAIEHVFEKLGHKIPVIYMSPRGETLTQEISENMSEDTAEMIILCGHYEGIDERIIELYVDRSISIGNYILSGGEIAAQVLMDTLIRHIPEVLGNATSLIEESFSEKLDRQKEYPLYTRPQEFSGLTVPEVLLSGNHQEIEKWKFNNLS